jgi:hypothetical protein
VIFGGVIENVRAISVVEKLNAISRLVTDKILHLGIERNFHLTHFNLRSVFFLNSLEEFYSSFTFLSLSLSNFSGKIN